MGHSEAESGERELEDVVEDAAGVNDVKSAEVYVWHGHWPHLFLLVTYYHSQDDSQFAESRAEYANFWVCLSGGIQLQRPIMPSVIGDPYGNLFQAN
jgi:hypothetical protein